MLVFVLEGGKYVGGRNSCRQFLQVFDGRLWLVDSLRNNKAVKLSLCLIQKRQIGVISLVDDPIHVGWVHEFNPVLVKPISCLKFQLSVYSLFEDFFNLLLCFFLIFQVYQGLMQLFVAVWFVDLALNQSYLPSKIVLSETVNAAHNCMMISPQNHYLSEVVVISGLRFWENFFRDFGWVKYCYFALFLPNEKLWQLVVSRTILNRSRGDVERTTMMRTIQLVVEHYCILHWSITLWKGFCVGALATNTVQFAFVAEDEDGEGLDGPIRKLLLHFEVEGLPLTQGFCLANVNFDDFAEGFVLLL